MTHVTSGWPVHAPMPRGGPTKKGHDVKFAMKLKVEMLAGVPLFAGLSKRQLHDLARGRLSRRWPAECDVVTEDTKSQVCFIIVEGTADVRRHGHTIAQLGPGEFFGEISLFDPGPRSATVTTTSEMTSVELSRQSFMAIAGDNAAILLRMLETLASRLRETTGKLP